MALDRHHDFDMTLT